MRARFRRDQAAFTPKRIPGLELWFDAGAIPGLADGGAVTAWRDLSGKQRDATQGTAFRQPTFRPNVVNGRPVVRFDGNDSLTLPTIDWSGTAAVTIVVVHQAGAGPTGDLLNVGEATLVTDGFYLRRNLSRIEAGVRGNVGYALVNTGGTYTTPAFVATAVLDKSLSTNEASVWINGQTDGPTRSSNSNNAGAFGNRPGWIGGRAETSDFFTGDLGELLVYGRALDAGERAKVEAYLRKKWGTP